MAKKRTRDFERRLHHAAASSHMSRRLGLLLGFALPCLACTATVNDDAPTKLRSLDNGLELHWSFEDRDGDVILDLSGNGRHGALHGGSFVSSPLGEALSLDGVDDYVALDDLGLRDPGLYGGGDGSFTISARVRVTDVDKYNTLCFGCGPFSSMFIGTPHLGPRVLSAVYNQQTGGSLWPSSSAGLVNDEWREVTMIVEDGAVARTYLDCQLDAELTNPDIGLHDYNFSAVGMGSTADRWYGGEIDQLRVWSRALTGQELAQLCLPPLWHDLELHWTFEDRDGDQVLDLSGNERHGTLHGGGFVSSPLGEAVKLNGVDDYIALPHLGLREPSLYGGVAGDFTISARVRVPAVDKYNTLCFGCGPFSSMFIGTPNLGPRVLSGLYNQQTGGSLWPTSSAGLLANHWREVTLVVEGGAVARTYLDCQLDAELYNPDIGLHNYNFSAIGMGSSPDRWYEGEIDQLRVWSRAMAAEQLPQLCPKPPPLTQGLQLHWTFENHNGDTILDVSGNGRHGTLHGGAFVSSPHGEAVSLDGVDDYIALTHLGLREPSLYGGGDGSFTISARVRVADVDKYNTLCFGCGPFSSMFIGTPNLGPKVLSGVYNQQTGGSLWPISSAGLVDDEWREVTLVVEHGAVARTYLDCQVDAELHDEDLGLHNYNFSAVGLGSTPERWYGGEIDDLRVWNRALSQQELSGLCDGVGAVVHVDIDAPPGGDGKSWATAFNDLQAAIDASLELDDPELWVAEGTYAPDPNAPVATISVPMAIYAGFAGTETSRAQRDIDAHPVVLGAPGWQSRVVVIESGAVDEVEPLRLDGFTIDGSEAGAIELTGMLPLYPPINVFLHNLEITNNSADIGTGVLINGIAGVEIRHSHIEGNVATSRGAAVYFTYNARVRVHDSSIVGNQGTQAAIYKFYDPTMSHSGNLIVTHSVMSHNVGGAVYGGPLTVEEVEFRENTDGRVIRVLGAPVNVKNCDFIDNSSGAIMIGRSGLTITDSSFSGNSANHGGALALYHGDSSGVSINRTEFVGNSASSSGGAIHLPGGNVQVHESLFMNNLAPKGGALHVPASERQPKVNISDSRFVANEATSQAGGGLAIDTHEMVSLPLVTIVNTEFVGNLAATGGGGVFGRPTLIATTFANNLADGQPQGLYSPSDQYGSTTTMTLRDVVAWPDTIVAESLLLDHSCIPEVTQAHTNEGSVWLVADPFAPADLDLDGLTEFYLDPGSACVDLGGEIDEFDWSAMTTQASQCTDTPPIDAGVHYPPLFSAGPC
jgi:hypothetical protein